MKVDTLKGLLLPPIYIQPFQLERPASNTSNTTEKEVSFALIDIDRLRKLGYSKIYINVEVRGSGTIALRAADGSTGQDLGSWSHSSQSTEFKTLGPIDIPNLSSPAIFRIKIYGDGTNALELYSASFVIV